MVCTSLAASANCRSFSSLTSAAGSAGGAATPEGGASSAPGADCTGPVEVTAPVRATMARYVRVRDDGRLVMGSLGCECYFTGSKRHATARRCFARQKCQGGGQN